MKMMGAAALLACAAVATAQDGTGRDLLFSDPTAELPDVRISESVKYVNEGSSFFYTVQLTHQPGLREDQTTDQTNDEVRIFLSSSQEVYQQGVAAQGDTADDFVQTLGHRTQLVIDTNVVECAGGTTLGKYTDPSCFSAATSAAGETLTDGQCLNTDTGAWLSSTKAACQDANERFKPTTDYIMGPIPYVYVAYSTKNPSQPSNIVSAKYQVVCPLCLHSKWCTHGTAIITGSDKADGASGTAGATFDGCTQITYTGFAPIYDACYAGAAGAVAATTTAASAAGPETISAAANRVVPTADGSFNAAIKHCYDITVAGFDGVSSDGASLVGKLLIEPLPMGRGYLDDGTATNYALGVMSPPLAAGGVGAHAVDLVGYRAEIAAAFDVMPGNSDFRITAKGEHPKRRVKDYSPYCRYCAMPGVTCHTTAASACPDIEVNAGDTAPGSCSVTGTGAITFAERDYGSKYECEAKGLTATPLTWDNPAASVRGWRGDVSSGAQLVFDSYNWDVPQTVKVTARDDDVYEPEVFGRGQDAYVHHYVVAQDINLQHTYYDDIDVNSLTVSVTDNDAAVVLETTNSLTPTELGTYGAPSTLTVMAANGQAAAHSTGCSDPQHKDYNRCLAAKSCQGVCDDNAIAAAAASAPADGTGIGTYTLTVTVDAGYAVGDTVKITSASSSSATCAITGTYTIASITGTTAVTFNEPFAAHTGTVTDCQLERDAPTTVSSSQEGGTADKCFVGLYTTQATCTAVTAAACYTDAVGTALAGSAYSTEKLCEGHDGTSTAGTCAGAGPSTATTCTDSTLGVGGTGSACTTKKLCTAAGFAWHPAGYVWIDVSSNLAWVTNTWGGDKSYATSVANAADEVVLQLASEPMYDVTVYVQSGAFFSTTTPTGPDDFLPDDEQVIFQDKGQATTCAVAASGLMSDATGVMSHATARATGTDSARDAKSGHSVATSCVADASTVPMCDPQGYFVSSQAYLDRRAAHATVNALPLSTEGSATEGLAMGATSYISAVSSGDGRTAATASLPWGPAPGLSATGFVGNKLPTKGHDVESCSTLTVEADCVAATHAGCTWSSGCTFAALSGVTKLTGMDLVCFTHTTNAAGCAKMAGCAWEAAAVGTAGCYAHRQGFTCNSFLTFSSTNWNVPQTLMAIAVPDDDDETPSGSCASSAGVIDYSITTSAACTTAAMTWTADSSWRTTAATGSAETGATPYGVDKSEVGYLIVSDDWYYNSDGAELIDNYKDAYHPIVDGQAGYCTTTVDGLVDYTKTTEATCDTAGTQTWQWTGPAAGVKLSMFDTRFGDHINRYPFTFGDILEYGSGATSTINQVTSNSWDLTSAGCAAVAKVTADTFATLENVDFAERTLTSGEVRYGCPIKHGVRGTRAPTGIISAITAADPAVATVGACTLATGQRVRIDGVDGGGDATTLGALLNGNEYYITVTVGTSGTSTTAFSLSTDWPVSTTVDSSSVSAYSSGGTVDVDYSTPNNQVCLNNDGYFDGGGAQASAQVSTFAPDSYAGDGVTCGSTTYTQDKNARGVVISRSACEVTEGRRHFYKSSTVHNRFAANMLENPSSLGNQLGLFVPRGDNVGVAYTAADADAGTNYMDDWAMASQIAISAATTSAISTSCMATYDDSTPLNFRVGDSVTLAEGSANDCGGMTPGLLEIATLVQKGTLSEMTFVGQTSCTAGTAACTVARAAGTAPVDGWTSDWANAADGGGTGGALATVLTPGTANDGNAHVYDPAVAVMSMPVCPFTIALTSAPAEGATVVVKVGEDENLASLRDNELYFFEEPTFRLSEKGSTGSAWTGGLGPFSTVNEGTDIWATDAPTSYTSIAAGTGTAKIIEAADNCERAHPGSHSVFASESDEPCTGTGVCDSLCYINNVGTSVDNGIALTSVTPGAAGTAKLVIVPGSTAWSMLSAMELPVVGDTIQVSPLDGDAVCEIAGTYTIKSTPTCATTAGPPSTDSCTEFFTEQPLTTPADATKCVLSKPLRPNGGTSINVKFTDDDWNVPRRITVIALNDDVDEPHETRKVYFKNGWTTSGTWQGVGSGPGVAAADCKNCLEDPNYRDTVIGTVGTTGDGSTDGTLTDTTPGPIQYTATGQYATGSTGGSAITSISVSGTSNEPPIAKEITVDVVDDDIADLVVLCGAGGGMPGSISATTGEPTATASGFGMASGVAIEFLGSYDDALLSSEANEILGLDLDGTMNRIGASTTLGLGGKVFAGGIYDGDTSPGVTVWAADISTVAHTTSAVNADEETITLASTKAAMFAVGDRIEIKSCVTALAQINGFHTIESIGSTSIGTQVLSAASATAKTLTTSNPAAAGFAVGDRIQVIDANTDTTATTFCHLAGEYTVDAVSAAAITVVEDFPHNSVTSAASHVVGDCSVGRLADVLGFAEGSFGYQGTAITADASACTIQGAVKRLGYEAEDGMAAGAQYGFGGGIVASAASQADVPAAEFGGRFDSTDSLTSSTVCDKYHVYDAAGAVDASLSGAACVTEAALQDGCVWDSSLCKGGVGPGSDAATGYAAPTDNTVYADTYVDWTSYDSYSDRYLLADGKTPASQGVFTNVASNVASIGTTLTQPTLTHHIRGFKGVGPARTEGKDNYACTIHTRECAYNPPKGLSISATHTEAGFCYTIADNAITADNSAGCTGASKAWGYYVDGSDVDAQGTDPEARAHGIVDLGDTACHNNNVGSFKIRLNSSPGQKTVKRQYVGETTTVYEKELVYIVVTPDATAQTTFSPTSVTFTETGGLVNGVATQRWDKPASIEVRPVDDAVDERRGATVDFTAFSIKQSHEADDYWTYATPYMNIPVSPAVASSSGTCNAKNELGYCSNSAYTCAAGSSGDQCAEKCKDTCEAAGYTFLTYPATGSAHAWGDISSFRAEEHTPFRHTIRTVHTLDNDYAGVTVTQPSSGAADVDVPENQVAGTPGSSFTIPVTEGASFGYYTVQLDTQPALIQRQAGTSPNKDIAFSVACDHDGGTVDQVYKTAGYVGTYDGAQYGDYYYDNTKLMRSDQCGSVVPPEYYWVDVTATQTIQLDLATPASCPVVTPWGGGSSPENDGTTLGVAAEHKRFPFNGKNVIGGADAEPYDEVNHRGVAMDDYLTTCGGWQRDATYRFTANDWSVPQYVYFYAHNDKDGLAAVTAISADVLSAATASAGAHSTANFVRAFLTTSGDPVALGYAYGDVIEVEDTGSCQIQGVYVVHSVTTTKIYLAPIDGGVLGFHADVTGNTITGCSVKRNAIVSADGIGSERNDNLQTYYSTTIKHYVETEDTMDNMATATPIAAAAASGVSGNTVTVTVASDYQAGDQVRLVQNTASSTACEAIGVYTILSITGTTAVTFVETLPSVTTPAECSLVGATGRCTSQGSQTTAQIAAKGMTACTAAGGMWTPSFVQRNKHGGIYTYGNLERYPFGRSIGYTDSRNAQAFHHETGFTSYGYTSYESLYGYTAAGAATNAHPGVQADASKTLGVNIGTDCGSTEMDITTQTQASALWDGTAQALGRAVRPDLRLGQGKVSGNTGAAEYAEPGTLLPCVDLWGQKAPFQYMKGGMPCVPMADGAASGTLDVTCVPRFAEASTAHGVAGFPATGCAIILAASGSGDRSGTTGTGGGYEEGTATGTALNNPPVDVIAQVTDNDDITEQATAAVAGCRATALFQYADSAGESAGQQATAVGGRGVFKKQWLTDYNCDSGDAGGLPGYPVAPTRSDGVALAGYCTDGVAQTQSACEAVMYCTVAGACSAPTTATAQGECGTCATTAGEPTATNRFTQAECIKDSDGDSTPDGVWSAATWTAATSSSCAPTLGGAWTARTWVAAPAGDATTGWQAVKAASAGSPVAATAATPATKTFTGDVAAAQTTATFYAVGDTVTITGGGGSCSAASCAFCGTYHIALLIGTNGATGVTFVEAFTSSVAGDATHCTISRAAVTLQTVANKQCCSCVPATGSTVTAASLAVHNTESACTTDAAGARLGGTWVCMGVGPYCTGN